MARVAVRFSVAISVMSIGVAFAAPASGQTVTDARVWTGFVAQGRMADGSPWRWSCDTLVRMREGASTLDFLSGRLIISRNITRRSTVGAGYAYGSGFPDDGGTFGEHRFLQQYIWSVSTGTASLSLRTRVEERLIEGDSGALVRTRQHVRVSRSLSAGGQFQFVASEEVFLYANTTARASRGFDSSRVFAGVRRAVTPRTGVEIGYVNIYARIRSGPNRRSHVLSANLVASF